MSAETATDLQTVPEAQVLIKSEEELDSLMDDLRDCARKSRRSGGRYSCGVADDRGKIIISVWLPYVIKKARK